MDITESTVGTRLGKRIDNMIEKIHEDLDKLEVDGSDAGELEIDADK